MFLALMNALFIACTSGLKTPIDFADFFVNLQLFIDFTHGLNISNHQKFLAPSLLRQYISKFYLLC